MKKISALITFVLLMLSLHSQDFWELEFDPLAETFFSNSYSVNHLIQAQDGGYLISGYDFYQTSDYPLYYNTAFVMKIDSEGNVLWADVDTLDTPYQSYNHVVYEDFDDNINTHSCTYDNAGGAHIVRNQSGNRLVIFTYNNQSVNSVDFNGSNLAFCGVNADGPFFEKIASDSTCWDNPGGLSLIDNLVACQLLSNDKAVAVGYSIDDYDVYQKSILIVSAYGTTDDLIESEDTSWNKIASDVTETPDENILVTVNYSLGVQKKGSIEEYDIDSNLLFEFLLDDQHFYDALKTEDGNYIILADQGLMKVDNLGNVLWQNGDYINDEVGNRSLLELNDGYLYITTDVDENNFRKIKLVKTNLEGEYTSSNNDEIPSTKVTISNYPNPFKPSGAGRSPSTTIKFSLNTEDAKSAKLHIYNLKGQEVKDLTPQLSHTERSRSESSRSESSRSEGLEWYEITWNGSDNNKQPVPSGIYLYKLSTTNYTVGNKMILLK